MFCNLAEYTDPLQLVLDELLKFLSVDDTVHHTLGRVLETKTGKKTVNR